MGHAYRIAAIGLLMFGITGTPLLAQVGETASLAGTWEGRYLDAARAELALQLTLEGGTGLLTGRITADGHISLDGKQPMRFDGIVTAKRTGRTIHFNVRHESVDSIAFSFDAELMECAEVSTPVITAQIMLPQRIPFVDGGVLMLWKRK